MDTQNIESQAHEFVQEADRYARENPVPVVVGALVVGLVVGLLIRTPDRETSKFQELKGQLEEAEDNLRSLLSGIGKATRKNYKKGADAVRGAVDSAVDAAQDIDVSDYVDPASKWFRKLWRKYVQ
jgi:ElaB/YqjD/DUF883 family membrane-anchored ribosome-binding protein